MSVAAFRGGILGARSRLGLLPLSLIGWYANCNNNPIIIIVIMLIIMLMIKLMVMSMIVIILLVIKIMIVVVVIIMVMYLLFANNVVWLCLQMLLTKATRSRL